MCWEFVVLEESIWHRLSLRVCVYIQDVLINRIFSTTIITGVCNHCCRDSDNVLSLHQMNGF